MKFFRMIIPLVLSLTLVSSLKAQELSQAQLNDIAAKMIPIYYILLLDDSLSKPTMVPEIPFDTNVSTSIVTITGKVGTKAFVNGSEFCEINASGECNGTLTLDEGDNNVSVVLKDKNGNESEPLNGVITVDTIAPVKLELPVEPPSETNSTELNITVSGEPNAIVWVNGIQVGSLDENGESNITLNLSNEDDNNFTITQKDSVSNESEALVIIIKRDTIAPSKPIVADPNPIPSETNSAEWNITVSGEPNATVWVNGTHIGTLDSNGEANVTLNLTEGENNISITLKDDIGNESEELNISIIFIPEINPPTAVKFIQDINPDDENITDGELGVSTTIDVKIDLSNSTVGDTLVYNDIYNTVKSVVINVNMISNGYLVKLKPRILWNHYEVCAHVTHGSKTSEQICDKTQYIGENANINAEIVTDLNNDGNVTIHERNGSNEINVTVLFNDLDETKTYDLTLTTTNPNAEILVEELNASTIENGHTHTYTVAGNNELFTVSAQLSIHGGADQGKAAEENATIEKGYPGNPSIEITEDINNDGNITFDERNGTIGVRVTLPANAQVGDVLILKNEYRVGTIELTLTTAHIALGTIDFEVMPKSNNTYRPCAKLRNNVGIESLWVCDEAKLAPYSHLWIYSAEYNAVEGAIDNDGNTFVHMIPTHLDDEDNVTINIDMPDDIELNMRLEYNVNNGELITVEINQTVINAGEFTFTIDPILNEVYTVFAKLERPHTLTNKFVGTYKFKVIDKEPTAAPIVEIIEDINNNGFVESGSELNGTVDVNITLPVDTHIGDTLVITDGNGLVIRVDINQSMINDGYIVAYAPVIGNLYNIKAIVLDSSGNESAEGSDSAKLIDTYTGKPTITFPQDSDGNGKLSPTELPNGTNVQIKITFAEDTSKGDKLYFQDPNQLGFEEIEITQAMLNTGHIIREYGYINNQYSVKAYIGDQETPINASEKVEGVIIVE